MAIQLNPNASDPYETKTLYQLRRSILDALGYIYATSGAAEFPIIFDKSNTIGGVRQLGPITPGTNPPDMVTDVLTHLGIAVGQVAVPYTLGAIRASLFSMLGMAAMISFPPPGVVAMLNAFIDQACQSLYRDVETDFGTLPPPNRFTATDTSQDALYTTDNGAIAGAKTVVDGQAVLQYALGLGKMHYGQEDGAVYVEQSKKYLADLSRRGPPNIVAIVTTALIDAHRAVLRRPELGVVSITAATGITFVNGQSISLNSFAIPTDTTLIDSEPVFLLALANVKTFLKQEDSKSYFAQFEQYMKDLRVRLPPEAIPAVNRALKDAQIELYRQYRVFRMERWFTWTLQQGQRFYPIQGNDERQPLPTPSGVQVVLGTAGNFGQMTIARQKFGFALVSGGKFLVAGGFDGANNLASAELYDPNTGLFTPTGSMQVERQLPITIPVLGGLVLVAGGLSGTYLAECELYNPQSGIFVPTGSMSTPRSATTASATLLVNGSVLVLGGVIPGGSPTYLNTGEVYNPSVGTWSPTGNMTFPTQGATATILTNGTVLVAGGISTGGITNAGAQLYNSTSNSFAATGNMNHDRTAAAAVRLGNGKVLVAGGSASGTGTIATCEVYDPALGTWANVASLGTPRQGHTLTILPDGSGKVLAAGGLNAGGAIVSTAEIYDPVANTWTAVPGGMSSAREFASAISGGVGNQPSKIFIAGGQDNTFTTVATMDIYNPANNSFSTSGISTSTNRAYRVAARDTFGKTTLAAVEVSIIGVPAYNSVVISWTPLTQASVAFYDIFGRASGAEQYLGSVPATQSSFTDYGTLTPGTVAPNLPIPSINTTGGQGPILDQREMSWVGASQGDINWRPLQTPVPPQAYTNQVSGIPHWYGMREQIEIWPPPPDSTWMLRIKGYFILGQFEQDTDVTSIDWQAVYLYALAKAKAAQKRPDAVSAMTEANGYVGALVAGSHGVARYIPGRVERNPVPRPVMLDSMGNPIP